MLKINPFNIYLFTVNIEALEKGVKKKVWFFFFVNTGYLKWYKMHEKKNDHIGTQYHEDVLKITVTTS